MVFRDRQGPSPQPSEDPIRSSTNRDRYLDNCFLLCINRNDDIEIPEIHRLENNFMRELCNKNQKKSQQQLKTYFNDPPEEQDYNIDDEDYLSLRQQKERDYMYRRKDNQQDQNSQILTNRSRYYQDGTINNYQYSRPVRYDHQNDYNIMQHSDDELSVYEVYVSTNTLNRLSDKRIDNNMVLIDYEDVSMMHDIRNGSTPYGQSPRNIPSQYNNYQPLSQYNDYDLQYQYDSSVGFPKQHNDQLPIYPNIPPPQQQYRDYYGNERDRQAYSPQSGPFFPPNVPIDHSNKINVRRHIYSPSQLPQGLTEGQLVMLLQKGNQYYAAKAQPLTQNEPQRPSSTTAVTISHQPLPVPNTHIEPFQNSEYVSSPQIKLPQVPPQIIDHRLTTNEERKSIDEIAKPMATLNTPHAAKPQRDIESKESEEKKKDKTNDLKKDKKEEKDDHHKKDGKKEKSSGKDSKKKKK
ncbi:hypothetical protein I4U23_008708 [Adineta vaga]|nr:hypothetical protein I4U23_008708 [Adineta vaga]